MKKLLLLIAIASTAFIQKSEATPFLQFLGPIRTEIVNQQVIVSNAPTLNKPLATALRKALLQIDRTTPTNLVNDTKALSTIAATLNKTALSNVFDPLIRTSLGNYVGVLGASLHSLSNSLLTAFPSGPHTAANNLINAAFDSIDAIIANGNTTLATKALAAVVKKLPAIQNLLTRAINAPAPPAQFKATITGAVLGNFNFTPAPARAAVAVRSGSIIAITGINIKRSGSGLNTVITTRTLVLNIPIADGTHVYSVADSGANVANVIYTVAQGSVSGPTGGDAYAATSGTVTVTMNTAAHTAAGTFSFSAPAQGTSGTTASSDNGTFSVLWME